MDLLKPLSALLAIANPIGVVPFFIDFTQNFSRAERQRTMHISAFSAFLVIAVSALAGLKIIEFSGISIASFQVGGGMLLLISAMTMLNARLLGYGVVVGLAACLAFSASGRIARWLGARAST